MCPTSAIARGRRRRLAATVDRTNTCHCPQRLCRGTGSIALHPNLGRRAGVKSVPEATGLLLPGIEPMKPFPSNSLNFREAYGVGDQLWAFGAVLEDDPKYPKPANWILTYRYAVRAMVARIMTVDRDYRN